MWQILEHKRLGGEIVKIPVEVLKRYEKWKDIVSLSGPMGLTGINGFQDEAPGSERRGQCSSLSSSQCRVIYQIKGHEVIVEAIDVTTPDYSIK